MRNTNGKHFKGNSMTPFPPKVHGGETLTATISATSANVQSCFVVFRALGAADILARHSGTREGEKFTFAISSDGWAPARETVFFEIWEVFENGYTTLVSSGSFKFLASIAQTGAAYDPRTTAQKIVEMLEKAIAGTADPTVKSYQINNRRIDRYSTQELLDLLKYWRRRAAAETGKPQDVKFTL